MATALAEAPVVGHQYQYQSRLETQGVTNADRTFHPPYIDAFFPEVGIATLDLLERFGHDVD